MDENFEKTAEYEVLEAELHRTVGQMVATWSQLESWLAHILTLLLVGNGSGRQGETIYYEVTSLKTNLAIVKAAFFNHSDLNEKIHDTWGKLSKAIIEESIERNKLIHGDFQRGGPRVGISPKIFSDIRRLKPPPGELKIGFDSDDVRRHIKRVECLKDALWALYGELPNSKDGFPPKSATDYLEDWHAQREHREWPSRC